MSQSPGHEPNVNWNGMSDDAKYAVQAFLETVDLEDDFAGGPYAPEGYLESYLFHWLTRHDNGLGIAFTRGCYEIFIEAAMWLVEIAMNDPTAFNCSPDKPRHILGVFEPNLNRPRCFDRRTYENLKFDYLTRNDDV